MAVVVTGLAWQLGRLLYPFPEAKLLTRRPSCVFSDRHGRVLRAELGDNDSWQIPVSLSDMSPYLVHGTLAAEDKRFWSHRGVDWIAAVRALLSNVSSGRTVSGASTVSMQLARLVCPEGRSLAMKARQVFRAIDLERRRDKSWILEHYLNTAPYGGNVIGVEAAALCYFGKSAGDLSFVEATLLAGLPQRPSALRPDRYPKAARQRQAHVIRCMTRRGHRVRRGWMPGDEPNSRSATVAGDGERSGGSKEGMASNRLGLPMTEEHFCRLAALEDSAGVVHTSLDPGVQLLARATLGAHVRELSGVGDGAVVVVENRTGAVRALVGTVDFRATVGGQVNAACMRRSPGSALKPFIYLMALDGGLIVPETRVSDCPLTYEKYRPNNFDGMYSGGIQARQALARSRNTPAVRLLEEIGPERLIRVLRSCGIRTLDRGAEVYGLSLALGGGEVTLLQLTNAYAGLARGGVFFPCRFTEPEDGQSASPASTAPFANGSVALLADMLRTYSLPDCPNLVLAWKTGTSNGLRDAWCIAFNDVYTIGVWIGNKEGRPSPSLVGIEAAAPVVAALFQGMGLDCANAGLRDAPTGTRPLEVCRVSGLRARHSCAAKAPALGIVGVPLNACERCASTWASDEKRGDGWRCEMESGLSREKVSGQGGMRSAGRCILSPESTTYAAPTQDGVTLQLCSSPEGETLWFVDGRYAGRHAEAFTHTFAPGTHEVRCLDPGDQGLPDVVLLSVTPP
ncbi:MAG: penicillin-binding protein 1C [Lentisphaerae bacterium]|jgi:penicillin-binding protein 1C|nr:penicillin-binding protein 1C [Lentisphaerota bacterium]MBT5610896.1 penicillin-binding protein 1C [Lentisphaerota bacterium]MBT7059510.1 penicillin-binding protein 1C [Lentisphaerota bacterium]MBT7846712.1 penicillin-binding protein 1C [Lentisphaerota bacterium]